MFGFFFWNVGNTGIVDGSPMGTINHTFSITRTVNNEFERVE